MQRSEDLQFIIYRGACGGGPAYVRAPTGGEQFIMYSEMQQGFLRAAADSKDATTTTGKSPAFIHGRGEAGVYGHGLDLTRMLTSVLCVCACVVVGGGGPRTHAHTHKRGRASERARTGEVVRAQTQGQHLQRTWAAGDQWFAGSAKATRAFPYAAKQKAGTHCETMTSHAHSFLSRLYRRKKKHPQLRRQLAVRSTTREKKNARRTKSNIGVAGAAAVLFTQITISYMLCPSTTRGTRCAPVCMFVAMSLISWPGIFA